MRKLREAAKIDEEGMNEEVKFRKSANLKLVREVSDNACAYLTLTEHILLRNGALFQAAYWPQEQRVSSDTNIALSCVASCKKGASGE